jgi:hypothetical protein
VVVGDGVGGVVVAVEVGVVVVVVGTTVVVGVGVVVGGVVGAVVVVGPGMVVVAGTGDELRRRSGGGNWCFVLRVEVSTIATTTATPTTANGTLSAHRYHRTVCLRERSRLWGEGEGANASST